ncbi:MAG: Rid family hydrolase [Candidatus Zipacnadales bacterium]
MSQLNPRRETVVSRTDTGLTSISRVVRPHYEELYISAFPPYGTAAATECDVAAIYRDITTLLSGTGATVVQERLYGSLIVQAITEASRAKAIAASSSFTELFPTYVEGLPCEGDGLAGVHLCAIVGAVVKKVIHEGRIRGHIIETPDMRIVYLSGLTGTPPHIAVPKKDQADAMFELANEVLKGLDFSYRNVIRTWIYISDILSWYDEFNAVRNAAYTRFGLLGAGDDYLPASTGIQGRPPGHVALTMDLVALQPLNDEKVTAKRLHNPLQNEAYAYGSAFARAMEVVYGNIRTVYVSGTASIDEFGNTIHAGNIDAQIERTVRNIEALIGTCGLTLADLCQATVFLKNGPDVGRFRTLCADTPLAKIGIPMVADVCRPDLLFEIDAVAVGPA